MLSDDSSRYLVLVSSLLLRSHARTYERIFSSITSAEERKRWGERREREGEGALVSQSE